MTVEITYQCELSEGIHARPAGHIARLCNGFHAEIIWHNTRTVLNGNAKSSLALVSTDTLRYDKCRITLCGCDEKGRCGRAYRSAQESADLRCRTGI
ncbi:HPr family phosphocarrier protein [Acerihabitans sp. KWT182]|uniref:HPr family phosphocarrier protein n=1 Tax=Acerihabitans sp. KWT182 TaxID=3157919 RepID=A0AAU7Q4F6_9GAMM